jgi:pimeloyl-ACP methyl ester carboxylesterase
LIVLRLLVSRMQQRVDFSGPSSGVEAFARFCTPATSMYRSPDTDVLVARARTQLAGASPVRLSTDQGDLQAYIFEAEGTWNGGSVLLVHGWTSEASFMTAHARNLRRLGFRVVLFDFPAHGLSAGASASLIDCAHSVREVAERLGPIDYVLAHSLGGMAALLAAGGRTPMPRRLSFRAFALVSMPNDFATITRNFGAYENLSPRVQREFEQQLEAIAHRKVADFTGVNLLKEYGRPRALLMHARDDADVAFAQAEAIAGAHVGAELLAFEDLGHRKILYAPPAVRAAGQFLVREHARHSIAHSA